MVTVVAYVAKAAFAYGAGRFFSFLLGGGGGGEEQRDDLGEPLTGRGSSLPYRIGRFEVSPIRCHVFAEDIRDEPNSTAGAKGGLGAGGGGLDNEVYYQGGVDLLNQGVIGRFLSIVQQGETIWPKEDEFPNGITPLSHPSGSMLECRDNEGIFSIYWGFPDQAVLTSFRGIDMALPTRMPGVALVLWHEKRLGTSGTWPFLKYDYETFPYKEGFLSTSPDYFAAASFLEGSEPWLRNSLEEDDSTSQAVLTYRTGPERLTLAGDQRADYVAGQKMRLRYLNTPPVTLDIESVGYNGSEVIVLPQDAVGTPRRYTHLAQNWNSPNATTSVSAAALPPGVVANFEAQTSEISNTSVGAAFPGFALVLPRNDSPVVPGASSINQMGTKINRVTVFFRRETPSGGSQTFPREYWFFAGLTQSPTTPFGGFGFIPSLTSLSPGIRVRMGWDGSVSVSNRNGAASRIFNLGGQWYRAEIDIVAGQGNTLTSSGNAQVFVSGLYEAVVVAGSPTSGAADRAMTFAVCSGAFPLLNPPLVRYLPGTSITGITTIQTTQTVSGYDDFTGAVAALRVSPQGMAGANAAHLLWQALVAPFPYGKGFAPRFFDRSSFEAAGALLEIEGVRCRFESEAGEDLSRAIQSLLIDSGMFLNWDPALGAYRLKVRRGLDPEFRIPEEVFAGDLPNVVKALDSSSTPRLGYSFEVAENSYRTGTLLESRSGSGARFEDDGGADISEMPSVADVDSAEIFATRRFVEDASRAALSVVELARDAELLQPGDVLDCGRVLGSEGSRIVLAVDSQPLRASCDVTLSEVTTSGEGGSVSAGLRNDWLFGKPRSGPERPVPVDDIATMVVDEGDGKVRPLRLAGSSATRRALLLGSDDGLSYWPMGPSRSVDGGEIVHVEGADVYVRESGASDMGRIELGTKDATTVLYDAWHSGGERGSLQSLEDLGDRLFVVTLGDMTLPAVGQFLFLSDAAASPSVIEAKLPTSTSPKFKIQPLARRASTGIVQQEIDPISVP